MTVVKLLDVIDLLERANDNGIRISFVDNKLVTQAPVGKKIDASLLRELKENKDHLISYFKEHIQHDSGISIKESILSSAERITTDVPLSYSQQRLWFVDQLEGSVQYHIPRVLRLKGQLHIAALARSFQAIINRHDVLRTVIAEKDGVAYQRVLDRDGWQLAVIDEPAYKEDATALRAYLESVISAPFNLSGDHMLRAHLICLSTDEYILVVTLHHIASDAWSFGIIVRELTSLYRAFVEGRTPELPPLRIQYADYAIWQRTYLSGDILERKLDYWKRKLSGTATLQLPADYMRPATPGTNGGSVALNLDADLSVRIKQLSQQQDTTLFMTLLTAFKVLLYRYSGQDDICVGCSTAERLQKEVEELIGFFVNMLALRSDLSNNPSFVSLLQQVKETTLGAYEHQDVSFEKVVEAVAKDREGSRNPLFDIMFVLQQEPDDPEFPLGDVLLSEEPLESNTTRFDMVFLVIEQTNDLRVVVEYSRDLYSEATIRRMIAHFEQLLLSVVNNPLQQIGSLQMLTPGEVRELTMPGVAGNGKAVSIREKTIVDLFEAQTDATPEAVALRFENDSMTYRELDDRANQLAHYLRGQGVTVDTPVPVCVESSLDMIVGILGVLKAGGAYVPIDPDFPADRIAYMLADTQATTVVSSNACRDKIPATAAVLSLDGGPDKIAEFPKTRSSAVAAPEHLVYVIYTSGSTGNPKGVMITHGNLADYLSGLKEALPLKDCRSFALLSSIATDLGNTVLYGSLLTGGCLHLFSKAAASDGDLLHDYFAQQQIDCIKIVPSHWKALSATGKLLLPVKILIFGGEALTTAVTNSIRSSGAGCMVVNHYGPTETTIGKLLHIIRPAADYQQTIPIGKPFSDTCVYVLDRNGQLCPVGIPGELYIGGSGVAAGYLNKEELTRERFMANPFITGTQGKLYRTGDIVKYLPDGNIVFIGRGDSQVKINGYRVEPGEIERVLNQCSLVRHGIIIVKEDSFGQSQLAAYVIPAGVPDRNGIYAYLKAHLPVYMLPASLTSQESFPMLANGKVDLKALSGTAAGLPLTDNYTAPRNDMEQMLADRWQALLGVERVGIHDDFFSLGGHSLLAMRLIFALRQSLQVELSIRAIFNFPTIAALAEHLHGYNKQWQLPPVEAAERPAKIPLSYSQERLWFIDHLEGSVQYHIPAVLKLNGHLHPEGLAYALKTIVNRHEVLRTQIIEEAGIAYQQVRDQDGWQLEIISERAYLENGTSLESYVQSLIAVPFDLSRDHMLRAQLIVLGEAAHILVVTMHHIASDGWSTGIIVKELMELYDAYIGNRAAQLLPLPIQYADYAIWQRKQLSEAVLADKLSYWKDKLTGVATLALPVDFARPVAAGVHGGTVSFNLDSELSEQIRKLSQQQGTTLFMTLLAAFKLLLYRYSGQEDICVGSPIAGRTQKEVEGLVGCFVNTLALRSEIKVNLSFVSLLQQVKQTTLGAYDHQEVPFEKVVEAVVKERDLGRSPLFQVMFAVENAPEVPELHLGEVIISGALAENTTAQYDLAFSVVEEKGHLRVNIVYRMDLFREDTIMRMKGHFEQLLLSVVRTPGARIDTLAMLTSAEEQQLLTSFNATTAAYPEDKIFADLFATQASLHPAAIAVVYEDHSLTYQELDERSNQVARYLSNLGVKADSLVPVCIDRSADMLVVLLGIMKAGGAYVPLDPDYPRERISYMLKDSGSSIVVSSLAHQHKIKAAGITPVLLDEVGNEIAQQPVTPLTLTAKPDHLAYVIYTSGSTGTPKGVMIEHQSLLNFLLSMKDRLDLPAAISLLAVTTYCFDIAYLELYLPLLTGGKVIIASKSAAADGFKLASALSHHRPTHMQATPATWQMLLEAGWENREGVTILAGGEAVPVALKDRLVQLSDQKVWNVYGPTEATIWATIKELKLDEKITIGRPLSNTAAYILDGSGRPVPVGVPGQLCIGGVQVARGYLNRPELTKEKFISNPFKPGERLYFTGDQARWLPDGTIEYLGRVDDQVKIRGYRVEPGEIESVVSQYPGVKQAVVVARTDNSGYRHLVCYVVGEEGIDRSGLLSWLQDRLPVYMVPSQLVLLDKLPLTANGKVDKKSLPDPGGAALLRSEYVAPRNETEQALAGIWQSLLGIERIGIYDNFFELGGHSLLAMRLLAAMRQQLQETVSIRSLFLHPVIASLAGYLRGTPDGLQLPAIEAATRPVYIPLSFSQERLWFIDQLEGSVQYHIPAVLRMKGALSEEGLAYALRTIVNRHEVLRTVIRQSDDEGGITYQWIMDKDQWQLEVTEAPVYKEEEAGLQAYISSLIAAPFDLSADHMLRARLVRLSADEHILVATLHHIASDEWSAGIIVKELIALYNAYTDNVIAPLAALPVQYADYAIWQRTYLSGAVLEEKLDYWKNKLSGTETLRLPADYVRPAVQSMQGGSVSFSLRPDVSAQVRKLSQEQGTTLFMTLLAAFKVLLYRYSNQTDICVGSSTAARQQQEVEGLVGFFVNTLALRSDLSGNPSFLSFLQQVKETTLGAYEHQDVPFEKVVEAVVKDRDAGRSPLFQAMFVMQQAPEAPELRLGEVVLSGESLNAVSAKFDITFFVVEENNELRINVVYRTDLFREDTMLRMGEHYQQLLAAVVADLEKPVGTLSILTPAEQQQLQEGFNMCEIAYPHHQTIIDLFREKVVAAPAAIALVMEDKEMTYATLDERSDQLAHYLQQQGVTAGALVPLCMERSLEMMIGILGILKAGAAYVPIDPDYLSSGDRVRYMLEDTRATVMVSSRACRSGLPVNEGMKVVALDADWEMISHAPVPVVAITPAPGDLVYVIYTSGSTGMPKGVMVTHRNLTDYLYGLYAALPLAACQSFALLSSIATDLGNTVLYGALAMGKTLHLFSKETASDSEKLQEYFTLHPIDCIKVVPSHWKALSASGSLLLPQQLLIFGGESLSTEVVNSIRASGSSCIVANHYGPTETTIGKLLHQVQDNGAYGQVIPVGKPFSNTRIYVLDPLGQLCPIGVPGELFIGGDGVALGYLNNPGLTDSRFIPDPFLPATAASIYRTGDMVKWLPDGNILFIGRADDQVKIRGYRVEPGEVERVLQQYEQVDQCVVVAVEDNNGNKRLAAYVIGNSVPDSESIVAYLKAHLPEYMIPSVFVAMEAFPMLPNGKIDKKALPDPEGLASVGYTAPVSATECLLAAIWSRLLEVERVGIHDDFFELGGHSLLAIRLVSAIRKELKVEVSIGDVFDYPTIAFLSAQLENRSDVAVVPAIITRNRPELIPLSYSQERLWFIDQLEGSIQYHVPVALKLKGKLNRDALSFALQTIVNRHEVLRTVVMERDGMPWQQVMDKDSWQLTVIEGIVFKDEATLQSYMQSLVAAPFNLRADHMLRAHLIRLSADDEEYVLLVTLHHIASDGWSNGMMVNELKALYLAYEEGRTVPLAPLHIQYVDYAMWQREYLTGDLLDKKLQYWKDKLTGVAQLQLPADYARPATQSTRGASRRFRLDKELSAQLQALSRQQDVTIFMTLLAAFNVLLYRYSGQEDICIGTPAAGRTQQELEELIGFFINTLALRTDLGDQPSFVSLLQQVKRTTLSAYEHQEVPFEKVVEAVVKERDLSRSPLFQVMFVMQNTPDEQELELGNLQLSPLNTGHVTAQFDLTVSMEESAAGLSGNMIYCADLFSAATIDRMIAHFEQLLRAVVKSPASHIGALPMLTSAEEHQLLVEFNNTSAGYPKDKTITDFFAAQVALTPEATAVVAGEDSLTYRELNTRANQLAHYLRSQGVQADTLVPICIERSVEMIVGILGILKAGGAYVPIDPDYPAERISFMLEDTAAKWTVSSRECAHVLDNVGSAELILLDEDWPEISQFSGDNPSHVILPRHLAYVIYTSGSTGKPKGVLIEHYNVVRLFETDTPLYDFNNNDVWTMFHSFCFDFSVWEMYGALLYGGKLVVISKEVARDPVAFGAILLKEKVTVLNQTPGAFYTLQESLLRSAMPLQIRYVIFGGEALIPGKLKVWKETYPDGKLINMYGITETTVHVTYKEMGADTLNGEASNIGKPIPTLSCYILDAHGNLLPAGIAGELYVGGAGLSRGYLNREQLTKDRFIADPFSGNVGARLYKTGDLARWLPDGNLEYLGRLDDQVKIRGYRIELGEIAAAMSTVAGVTQCALVAREDANGHKRLIGYVVMEQAFDQQAISEFLHARLPEYMVPSLIVALDALPLTSNGKVDRKKLPEPDITGLIHEYIPPRNETEQLLADIWQVLLGVERIGVSDNFFTLGGHSLLVMRLVSDIRIGLTMEISFKDIFNYPTIASLSVVLRQRMAELAAQKDSDAEAAAQQENGHVRLLNKGAKETSIFLVPGAVGVVDAYEELAAALNDTGAVYGLLMQGVLEGEKPLDNLEAVADQNITWMKQVQPQGPYRLIGHSFGVRVVYEMVKLLEARGEVADLVVLLDSSAAIEDVDEAIRSMQRDIEGIEVLEYVLGILGHYNIIPQPHPEWVAELRAMAEQLKANESIALKGVLHFILDFIKDKIEKKHVASMFRLFELRLNNMFMHYTTITGKVNATLTVVRATENIREENDDALGWSEHAAEIKLVTIEGDHGSMLENENAEILSRQLQQQLKALIP
ncbi:non-ribosomal peptide synthetase [Chitinophaga varians]|uniref:non-ribosomal peptide synthetase n=1 Tax=Chitinophaga varians TaxID=2202339 RepID=UPI00165F994B|nr:non-ribosomal peptide synthetase [Chitinophaga varians]MBC9915636.1 amino acid adenylation domain-containing protein [Chitinophaga varians]